MLLFGFKGKKAEVWFWLTGRKQKRQGSTWRPRWIHLKRITDFGYRKNYWPSGLKCRKDKKRSWGSEGSSGSVCVSTNLTLLLVFECNILLLYWKIKQVHWFDKVFRSHPNHPYMWESIYLFVSPYTKHYTILIIVGLNSWWHTLLVFAFEIVNFWALCFHTLKVKYRKDKLRKKFHLQFHQKEYNT